MRNLKEVIRNKIPSTTRTSPVCKLRPGEILFPWATRWFEKGRVSGISNFDLHNATRQARVSIGDVLYIKRVSDQDKNPHHYVYIEPCDPFIDEETGSVRHVFYDCESRTGSKVVIVNDIVSWQRVGTATKEQTIRLRRAIDAFNSQRRKR